MNSSPLCEVCQKTKVQHLFETADIWTGQSFHLYSCRCCQSAVTHPRPENLVPYYWSTGSGKTSRFVPCIEIIERRTRARRALAVARHARLQDSTPSVLDVGCGRGVMLSELSKAGWQCLGTELCNASAAEARQQGVVVKVTPLQVNDFAPCSLTAVTLWHSLEHLVSPRQTLSLCAHWLRPGGCMVVAVPRLDSLQAALGGAYWFHLDAPRHLHHFSARGLKTLLNDVGLEPEQWIHFSASYEIFGWLQTILNLLGFPVGLLYRIIHGSRGERRAVEALCLLTSLLLLPLALLMSGAAALSKRGATLEVWARKPSL